MKQTIFILVAIFLLNSCYRKQTEKDSYVFADDLIEQEAVPITMQEQNTPPSPLPLAETQEVVKKKIIKDGRMGIEVQELGRTKVHVDSLLVKYGGYYANELLSNSDRETCYTLTIRVPSDRFEKLIADVESGGGELKYKEIDARDVTDQFIDLETRLANKKNYLRKYNDLLMQAKSVKDILEIEERIRVIEEEIESTTGRLKYLADLVEYSTLDLVISKPKDYNNSPEKRDDFIKRLERAISKGWYGFVDFIVFIIKIWPLWITVGLAAFGWRVYRKRKKRKM